MPFSDFYNIRPQVNLSGSLTGETPTAYTPAGNFEMQGENQNIGGRIGFGLPLQGGGELGGGISGGYNRGSFRFPDEMKNLYSVRDQRYNTGLDINTLDAYYNTPTGQRYNLTINPPDQTGNYGAFFRAILPF